MPRVPPVTRATRPIASSLGARWRRLLRDKIRVWGGKRPPHTKIYARGRDLVALDAHLVALDAHGDAHAAADAQRGEALLGVRLLHLVQQRNQDTRARRTDG